MLSVGAVPCSRKFLSLRDSNLQGVRPAIDSLSIIFGRSQILPSRPLFTVAYVINLFTPKALQAITSIGRPLRSDARALTAVHVHRDEPASSSSVAADVGSYVGGADSAAGHERLSGSTLTGLRRSTRLSDGHS